MHRTLSICWWSLCVRGCAQRPMVLARLVLEDVLVWLLLEGSTPEIIALLASLSSLRHRWAMTFKPGSLRVLICEVGIVTYLPCLTGFCISGNGLAVLWGHIPGPFE